jgi:type II secretion system protein N
MMPLNQMVKESTLWVWGKMDRRTLLRWGAYCLYAVLLAGFLIWRSFPLEALKERLEASFGYMVPAQLTIKSARLTLPWNVALEGVRVEGVGDAKGMTYFSAEGLLLKPSITSFIKGKPSLGYEISSGTGRIEGTLKLPSGKRKEVVLDARVNGLQLTRGSVLKRLAGLELSGAMGGDLEVRTADSLSGGQGKVKLEVRNGKLSGFDSDTMPIPAVKFKEFKFEGDLGNGKLTVRRAEISGGDVNTRLSGLIGFGPTRESSTMDLRGTLSLSQYMTKSHIFEESPLGKAPGEGSPGLAYILSGPLNAPRFALEGAQTPKPEGDGGGEEVAVDEE